MERKKSRQYKTCYSKHKYWETWTNPQLKQKWRQWSGIDTITQHLPSKTPKGKKDALKATAQHNKQKAKRSVSKACQGTVKDWCLWCYIIKHHFSENRINTVRETVKEIPSKNGLYQNWWQSVDGVRGGAGWTGAGFTQGFSTMIKPDRTLFLFTD